MVNKVRLLHQCGFLASSRKTGSFSQARDSLTESAIETFNVVGLTTFLANGSMPLARQHPMISLPKVAVGDMPEA